MPERDGFILPNYNTDNVLLLWERVGSCLMNIQLFERVITSYIINVHKIKSALEANEIEELYNKYERFFLGKLFLEIKQCEKLPIELEERIESFIKGRNWLVHHSYKKNHTDVYNEEKFYSLINRISQIADEALSLSKLFQKNADEYCIKTGRATREELNEQTQNILNSWNNSQG